MSLVDQYGNPMKSTKSTESTTLVHRRITRDHDSYTVSGAVLAPHEDYDWKLTEFNEDHLATSSFQEILDVAVDAVPELNAALSNMQMFVNSRYEISVLEDDPEAERILQDAERTMALERKESLSTKLDKLVASGYLKGAFHLETMFSDSDGRFLDIPIVDSLRIRFLQVDDAELGNYYEPGQEINGQFVPFDSENVHYHPLGAIDGKKFGRSMVSSALYPMVFLLGTIRSARQFIETQAWPYQLFKIDPSVYKGTIVDENDTDEIAEKTQDAIDRVKTLFNNLDKGHQFAFDSSLSVEIIGALGRRDTDALEMIEKILKRQIILALKMEPTLFGITDGNALSQNSDVQLEAFAIFIGSFQDKLEEAITICLTQILRRAGNSSTPVFKLQRINSLVERQRAERMKIKTESVVMWLDNGIINAQEARTLLRTPEAFDQLSSLLDEEVPEDATSREVTEVIEEEVA